MEGFNSRCETLKNKIINNINDSGLPIGAVYFIYTSIKHEIENTYYASLNDEAVDKKVEKKDNDVLEENLSNE